MIVSRVAWLCACLLVATGCGTTVQRGYYAPLGAEFSKAIAVVSETRDGLIIEVTCQGVYQNTVDGKLRRTAHIQLDITRTTASPLLIPVDGMRLDFIYEGGAQPVSLVPETVWSRRNTIHETVLVNPWSNKSLDVFFDDVDADLPIPPIVRFRWRAESDEGRQHGDHQFLRIDESDPRYPDPLPASDKRFGVRNGYYFPGYGSLGARHLRDSVEARRHYLFHAP